MTGNSGAPGGRCGLNDLPTECQEAIRRGYEDVRHSRPWWDAIERQPRQIQWSYEAGRLHAVNIVASGRRLPEWGVDGSGVTKAMAEAVVRYGHPIPPVTPR